MKKSVYEAPRTERFQVELEGSFCASVIKEDNHEVESGGQEINIVDETTIEEWNKAQWS